MFGVTFLLPTLVTTVEVHLMPAALAAVDVINTIDILHHRLCYHPLLQLNVKMIQPTSGIV